MSAEFDTGFFVRQPAWHGLGNVLENYPGSWTEAAPLAGLDWDPEEWPVYDVTELYPDGTAKVEAVEGFKQIKRSDNGVRLAITSETYTPTPNSVMGEVIEALLEDGADVQYETAGALGKGERTWALLRLGSERTLTGDPSPVQQYLALLNSHDSSSALRAIVTTVRIVCANTWHAAEMQASRTGSCYTFKHTKGWRARVNDAKKALARAHDDVSKIMERAEELLAVKVDAEMQRQYIKQFAIRRVIHNTFGKQPVTKRGMSIEERLEQPKVKTAIASTIDELTSLLAGPTCQGINGTAFGLMQAAGEALDHLRPYNSQETYFTRTVIATEPMKLEAYKLARELANA